MTALGLGSPGRSLLSEASYLSRAFWRSSHETQHNLGAACPQRIPDCARPGPASIRTGKAGRLAARRDVRKLEVAFAVRHRRHVRTGRRHAAYPWPVHAAGGIYPVRRNGGGLFHRTFSTQLLSDSERRRPRRHPLLCLLVSFFCRRRAMEPRCFAGRRDAASTGSLADTARSALRSISDWLPATATTIDVKTPCRLFDLSNSGRRP